MLHCSGPREPQMIHYLSCAINFTMFSWTPCTCLLYMSVLVTGCLTTPVPWPLFYRPPPLLPPVLPQPSIQAPAKVQWYKPPTTGNSFRTTAVFRSPPTALAVPVVQPVVPAQTIPLVTAPVTSPCGKPCKKCKCQDGCSCDSCCPSTPEDERIYALEHFLDRASDYYFSPIVDGSLETPRPCCGCRQSRPRRRQDDDFDDLDDDFDYEDTGRQRRRQNRNRGSNNNRGGGGGGGNTARDIGSAQDPQMQQPSRTNNNNNNSNNNNNNNQGRAGGSSEEDFPTFRDRDRPRERSRDRSRSRGSSRRSKDCGCRPQQPRRKDCVCGKPVCSCQPEPEPCDYFYNSKFESYV